jgi:hypothetical protein
MAKDKPLQRIARSIAKKGTKGKFSRKAKRAGMSTAAYARKERHAPGALGKEARLAETFARFRKRGASKRGAKKRTGTGSASRR